MPAGDPERCASAPLRRQPQRRPARHADSRPGVCDPQRRPAPRPAWPPWRAGAAAATGRGDRDAQLPHRGRAQRREPAGSPAVGGHHRPPARTGPAPGRGAGRRADCHQLHGGTRTDRADATQGEGDDRPMADRPTCPSRTATRARLCPALTWSSTWTACWPPRRAGRGVAVAPVQVLHDQQQRRGHGQPLDHPQQPLDSHPCPAPATAAPAVAWPLQARSGSSRSSSSRAGPATHPTPPRPAGRPGRAVLGDRYERQAVLVERHVAAAQHPHALPAGDGGQPLGQPGRADSRLPPITATSGVPSAAWARSWLSRASSWLRPTKRPVETW
jgi:hypothetical protein